MNKLGSIIVAVALAAGVSAPALAQNAVLRVDHGTVMTSNGGEFASAQTGASLATGERVMVSEGSSATVIYDGRCKRSLNAPGVYVVDGVCAAAKSADSEAVDWKSGAIIAGAVAAGAAILASEGDSTTTRPVSR